MDDAAQGRVYRLSGVGPVSKASSSVRICALNHFEAFLECKGMPKLKDLTELQAVDVNLFREFESYLVDDAKINGSSLYTGVESSSAAPSSRVKSSLVNVFL